MGLQNDDGGCARREPRYPSRAREASRWVFKGVVIGVLASSSSLIMSWEEYLPNTQSAQSKGKKNETPLASTCNATTCNDDTAAVALPCYCPISDLKVGRWVPVTYDKPPYIPMQGEAQQNACPGVKPDERFDTWEWQPSAVNATGCHFAHFS